MKKTGILFAAAVCALIFAVCASAAVLGDVDGDGGVTASDARLALRAAVGLEETILPETEAFAAADADFNGKITADDARSILRAAVGLENLADRLPESEALSNVELEKRINACTVKFFVDKEPGCADSATGFVIDENGTVLVPYALIYKATKITVERENCRVEKILWADPVSGLALLKVSGELPYLSVNRTWFNVGDPVYSTDYMGALHSLTITAPPSDPDMDQDLPEWAIFASIPAWEYSFSLDYYLMADRFGRAIGLILSDFSTGEGRFACAVPLSLLPSPEAYNPRTVKEFSRDEWRITLYNPVESVSLVQYGTGLIPLYAEKRTIRDIKVVNPKTDLINVSVAFREPEYPILVILAKQLCENVPVTVRMKGLYEDLEITLSVSVTADGYVNMVGAPFMPDPGVIWETLPTETYVGDSFSLKYRKADTGLSDEDLFYLYTDYLQEMGFEYVETDDRYSVIVYSFRLEELSVNVVYAETVDSVSVGFYFDE